MKDHFAAWNAYRCHKCARTIAVGDRGVLDDDGRICCTDCTDFTCAECDRLEAATDRMIARFEEGG